MELTKKGAGTSMQPRSDGYFGIGIENVKSEHNVGTLWRSAQSFGASFIFTIGARVKLQTSDTGKAHRSLPLYRYPTFDDFHAHIPFGCWLVGVEFPHEGAVPLQGFVHPPQCVYLLGSEDHGLSKQALEKCRSVVFVPCRECLNVAVVGSIVMYDRSLARL